MLEVERPARSSYGKIEAVKGISFNVEAGQVVTLIGANGAGKTTTLRTHLRVCCARAAARSPSRASASPRLPAHDIVQLGLAHSPEGRRIFPPHDRRGEPDARRLRPQRPAASRKDLRARRTSCSRPRERAHQPAGTFSGGEQQMLAMGRALMSRPKLLMLDEPSMGLSPIMMQRICRRSTELQQQGTTILLVEQNAQAALKLADYGLRARGRQHRAVRHRPGAARQRRGPQGLPRRGLTSCGGQLAARLAAGVRAVAVFLAGDAVAAAAAFAGLTDFAAVAAAFAGRTDFAAVAAVFAVFEEPGPPSLPAPPSWGR